MKWSLLFIGTIAPTCDSVADPFRSLLSLIPCHIHPRFRASTNFADICRRLSFMHENSHISIQSSLLRVPSVGVCECMWRVYECVAFVVRCFRFCSAFLWPALAFHQHRHTHYLHIGHCVFLSPIFRPVYFLSI